MTFDTARIAPIRAGFAWSAIAAMAVVYLAVVPFSITHLDLARDLGIGLAIADGIRFPLEGPVLAGSFHLGPVWYYLLALPLWLTHSWLATVTAIALLGAAKFPLAYALGTRLVDNRFGLLWAVLLLAPGWNTYETLLLLHTSLVATCTLALLWFVLRYAQEGATRHLIGAALLCALALHAHPATFALALVAALALFACWVRRGMRWRPAALAASAFVLPFVPYVAAQVAAGFPDIAGAAAYLRAENRVGSPRAAGDVLIGTFVTGPRAVADAFFGAAAAVVFMLVHGAIGALAAFGLVRWLARGIRRPLIAAGAALTLLLAVFVAAVRMTTPYYMTFPIGVIGTGLVALGLRAAVDVPALHKLVAALAAGTAGLAAATAAAAAATLAGGAYPFAFFPLFDVQAPYARGRPLPFMPAYAMAHSGDYLCAQPALVVHGAYAVHLLHDYALETMLRCGRRRPIIRLGGNSPPEDGMHVGSVSRTMGEALGLAPTMRIGPFDIVPVVRIPGSADTLPVPGPRVYPPTAPHYEPPSERVVAFDARGDEAVIVTDTHFAFSPSPEVAATLDGVRVAPAARDALVTAFGCAGCDPAAKHRWTVTVRASAPGRVDVATVRRSAR